MFIRCSGLKNLLFWNCSMFHLTLLQDSMFKRLKKTHLKKNSYAPVLGTQLFIFLSSFLCLDVFTIGFALLSIGVQPLQQRQRRSGFTIYFSILALVLKHQKIAKEKRSLEVQGTKCFFSWGPNLSDRIYIYICITHMFMLYTYIYILYIHTYIYIYILHM